MVGHRWTRFRAIVDGERRASQAREVRTAQWGTGDRLQALAERTLGYAKGSLTTEEFLAVPGLQSVWVRFLVAEHVISMSEADLTAIDALD